MLRKLFLHKEMDTEELEMDTEELEHLFQRHGKEYLKFERIQEKLSNRTDLHAFILLDKLCPKNTDIIDDAIHDEIYLDTSLEELIEAKITEEQVIDLIRCGVMISEYGLCMFV